MRNLCPDGLGRFSAEDAPLGMDERPVPPLDAYAGEFDPAPGLAFCRASDLEGKPVPARHWLVDGLVPTGAVTLLGGDGGTGKSLLALQLAAAVALGKPWIGHAITKGRAFYLSAEDDDAELERRIADVAKAAGMQRADLEGLTYTSLAGEDSLLALLDNKTGKLRTSDLFTRLDAYLAGERHALLVLDTLADLFPGNENDRTQARQFIGLLKGLAIRHKCAVLLLAHPSLSGLSSGTGTSGSTGWNNSARSRLYLERVVERAADKTEHEADANARVLKTKKANYGRIGETIGLTWREGVFVADAPLTALDRLAQGGKAERVFLTLLRMVNAQGRRVNYSGGKNYAPSVFATFDAAEGVTHRAFVSAMNSLMASGRIAIAHEGPPSRIERWLVVVSE